jgi:hypothetical protein
MDNKTWKKMLHENKLNEANSTIKSFLKSIKKVDHDSVALENGTEFLLKELPNLTKLANIDSSDAKKIKSDLQDIRKKSVELDKLILKFRADVNKILGDK